MEQEHGTDAAAICKGVLLRVGMAAARATPNAIATNRFRPSVPAPMRMMFLISCPSPMGAAACRARPLPDREGSDRCRCMDGGGVPVGMPAPGRGPSTRRRAWDGPQWVRRRGAA